MKSIRTIRSLPVPASVLLGTTLALALLAPAASALATTTIGTLSNFDTFNDTGDDCHGFEIELDGITSADVVYTFGDPYQRYGNPVVEDFAGGVYVRYTSGYDSGTSTWATSTPKAPEIGRAHV